MPKYRKKPVVIEAVQWTGKNLANVCSLAMTANREIEVVDTDKGLSIEIPTLEGVMTASPGDWIIKGVQGELYPCKPDIFEATYEPVEYTGTPLCFGSNPGPQAMAENDCRACPIERACHCAGYCE
jgi:hypothetical protein